MLRKHGTDSPVIGVESTPEAEEISKTASARPWDDEDEQELLEESEG